MKKFRNPLVILFFITINFIYSQNNDPIILGYFPSWAENWTTANQNSKLREVPDFVNHIFLAFAKPNLRYELGSYDISNTGIEVPYDGHALKESVAALKAKGIKVILSVGGETYWGASNAYDINYQHIKDLVDDIGFVGIDWDYEPNGSFAHIGRSENVNHFIDFFNKSRAIMPRDEGYILACAPAGVGALGGETNDDPNSPYAFSKKNTVTGESNANLYQGTKATNGINLYGFESTGHMIPVFKSVGDKIDLVAYQGYNTGGSTNRALMYDAYAYYADKHNFKIAAGVHYPDEPWGPHYEYTHTNVASLTNHIKQHSTRNGSGDGLMIWQTLLEDKNLDNSAYSYMNVASLVLNGSSETSAIQNANNYNLSPYNGGLVDSNNDNLPTNEEVDDLHCGVAAYDTNSSYFTNNTEVYYDGKIWYNKWEIYGNEIPGIYIGWVLKQHCNEENSGNDSTDNEEQSNEQTSNLYCGVAAYDTNSSYFTKNTEVYYDGKIWYNKWEIYGNEIPGIYIGWVLKQHCNEENVDDSTDNEEVEDLHCGVATYDANSFYYTRNTEVYYDGKIWYNKWYIYANERPGIYIGWVLKQHCNEENVDDSTDNEEVEDLHCGVATYDANSFYYTRNTEVYYDGKIWYNKWYIYANERPGIYIGWVLKQHCNEENVDDSTDNKEQVGNDNEEQSNEQTSNLHCGVAAYNANSIYRTTNTKVYYDGVIWYNAWYINPNEIPGINNGWKFDKQCDEGQDNEQTNLHCGVASYNTNYNYPTKNTEVYYDGKIWYNKWYINTYEIPGINTGWALKQNCNESLNTNKNHIILKPKIISKSPYIAVTNLGKREKISITSLYGRHISTTSVQNNGLIDTSSLSPGFYIASFENGNQTYFYVSGSNEVMTH